MYNIGGAMGAVFAFFFGSMLGRKRTILGGMGFASIGAVVQCAATSLGPLIAGRIMSGVGVGTLTSTMGLYQAEVVSGVARGRFLTLQVLAGAGLGLLLAQWINFGLSGHTNRVTFAFPLGFQLVFILIACSIIPFCPESPRWLVKQGRRSEARDALERLGTANVDQRLAEIDQTAELEKTGHTSQYRQMFTNGPTANFTRLCLAVGTMIGHQLNGINSVTYYMPTLLIAFIGASHHTALWVAGLTSVTSIVAGIFPMLLIDKVGRRPFLWVGAAIQTAIMIIIAVLLAKGQGDAEHAQQYGIAAISMIFFYFAVNSMTWFTASWAYPAEILPLQIREKGLALGNCFYWLFQFMIVEITPPAIKNIHYRFYVILAVLNALIAATVYLTFPETKGKTLEEIDFYFAGRHGDGAALRDLMVPIEVKAEAAKKDTNGEGGTTAREEEEFVEYA
jgi:sugar porter (SP) family MFS transporter